MSGKTPTSKSITDTIRTVDISGLQGLRQGVPLGSPLGKMVDTMQEVVMMNHLQDMQERQDLNRQQIKMERMKLQAQMNQGAMGGFTGATPGTNPLSKSFDTLTSNPEMMTWWGSLKSDEQQRQIMMLQQMGAISSPYANQGFNAMVPYMLMMQQKPSEQVSVARAHLDF